MHTLPRRFFFVASSIGLAVVISVAASAEDSSARERRADRIESKGERVDDRLDRRGDRIDARLDRLADRVGGQSTT